MPGPIKKETESDVSFSRSLLFHKSNAQNIQSWLSTSLAGKAGTTSVDEEQSEEIEVEADAEEGGLGYTASKSALPKDRQSHSANDKLRKQFLGKREYQNSVQKGAKFPRSESLVASKPRPTISNSRSKESDDEAEGRTSSTTKRFTKTTTAVDPDQKSSASMSNRPANKLTSKKRTATYLDEILAQRQKKRTKG